MTERVREPTENERLFAEKLAHVFNAPDSLFPEFLRHALCVVHVQNGYIVLVITFHDNIIEYRLTLDSVVRT